MFKYHFILIIGLDGKWMMEILSIEEIG